MNKWSLWLFENLWKPFQHLKKNVDEFLARYWKEKLFPVVTQTPGLIIPDKATRGCPNEKLWRSRVGHDNMAATLIPGVPSEFITNWCGLVISPSLSCATCKSLPGLMLLSLSLLQLEPIHTAWYRRLGQAGSLVPWSVLLPVVKACTCLPWMGVIPPTPPCLSLKSSSRSVIDSSSNSH